MIDKNNPMYANYPHLNQNKEKNEPVNGDPVQQDVIEDVSQDDELIINGGGNGDNGDNKKNKSKKKKWPIFIILLLVAGIAAFACFKLFGQPKDTEYINIGEEAIVRDVTLEDDADLDHDGLTNGEEKELGTDPRSIDTDNDGIIDFDEINTTKTDPLKFDTDGDTVDDGTEVALGLDPLNAKTDGTPDGERTFEISHKLGEGSLTVTGKSGVANIYAKKVESFNKANNPGIVSDMYEFYIEKGKFESAELQLTYQDNVFNNSDYTEDDLAIFQYMNDGTYKKVGGVVDKDKNTVTVELEHFSKYCLAVAPAVERKAASKVFIVLDNSGSMYPEEMCEGSDENDVDFKRVDFAKNLIEASNLDEVKFGAAKFTGDYTELCGGFDNSKETLFEKIESLKTTEETFNGTHIAEAIISACNNFNADDLNHRKFIILLTDGETTEGQGWAGLFDYNENDAIKAANKKNVSVIVVGLGNSVDSDYCTKIADGTNGKFIYVNNSSALEDVYEAIHAVMNNGYVDLDQDGEMDHIMIADSGFDMETNAFSFNNYLVKSPYEDELINGQCHGMAVFAQRYYMGILPQKADAIPRTKSALFGEWGQGVAYDLTLHEFFNNGDSNYTLSDVNLKDFVLFPEINAKMTGNIWDRLQKSEDDKYHLEFVPEFRKYIEDHPLLEIRTITRDSIATGKNKDGTEYKYKSYEDIYYTIDVDYDSLSDEHKAQYQVLAAFNNLWASQLIDGYYTKHTFNDDEFQNIIDWVNFGIIPVAAGEGHSTNLTQIYRDIDNPFKYTLLIYDNNDRNHFKSMELTLTKYNKFALDFTAWTNDYKFEIWDTDNIYMQGPGAKVSLTFMVYGRG